MQIAFVTYETPFAPCGGIAAVMGRLPVRVHAAARVDTIVVTPFHHRIEKMISLGRSHEGSFGVPVNGRTVLVHIYRHDFEKVPYFFLRAEDDRYFAGRRHPYDVAGGELLRDALFFGAATERALRVIGPGNRWTLLLQDWEAATTALALSDNAARCRAFITLHNSYDCPTAPQNLEEVGINPAACPGDSVLQRAFGVTDREIFTVSEQFARDLIGDTLQREVLAHHLQWILRDRLVGVDNGPFVDCAVENKLLADAQYGRHEALQKWKAGHRKSFLEALEKLQPNDDKPLWGDVRKFQKDDAPWFVMAGRDDARQKGYDVAARAVAMFLEQKGTARFLFFPIPGDEGRPGLGFLKKLADEYPENVLAFPFLFREGFMAALRGASFGVMPSLYEPFGMANEFYLNGTVAIGRATGGIIQQIVPLRAAASFGKSVQDRVARSHNGSTQPTGFLFREKDSLPSEIEDWRGINAARYDVSGGKPDRVEERSRYPLFESMAEELFRAFQDAEELVRKQPAQYFQLLATGVGHIRQTFSWDKAAQEYLRRIS